MARILITGRGGSGKSTICDVMSDHGYNSLDGDEVPGLSRWEDINTCEPVEVDASSFVDYSKVQWNWNARILKGLLRQDDIILCGSSSNQVTFYELFDLVLVLNPDSKIHEHRLRNRPSEYGKDEQTLRWVLEDQQRLLDTSVSLGATVVDASGSPEETVEIIERLIDDYSRMD